MSQIIQIFTNTCCFFNGMRYNFLSGKSRINVQHQNSRNIIYNFLPHFTEKRSGSIVNLSSIVSKNGQQTGVAYPTSKFAVNGLTVSLARELGPKGIRVNAVAPGITETDMMKAVPKEVIEPLIKQIPLRRLGRPEDIANAFVFLASDEASYITGVILSVDGMART